MNYCYTRQLRRSEKYTKEDKGFAQRHSGEYVPEDWRWWLRSILIVCFSGHQHHGVGSNRLDRVHFGYSLCFFLLNIHILIVWFSVVYSGCSGILHFPVLL